MVRIAIAAFACLAAGACQANAQSLGDILGDVMDTTGVEIPTQSTTSGSGLTTGEISAGLKEALTIGAQSVGAQLSADGGYFNDGHIRIPLPGVLGDAQERLQPFGMSGALDDLQLRMNTAAEAAAPQARDLVVEAVQSITLDDAVGILNGGDSAATDYLRGRTETSLQSALRPHVEGALADSGALSAVDGVASRYGVGELGSNARTSLTDHAVEGALDGLFYYLAKEEAAIRSNPVERTTDLLKKVFGS